MKNARPIVLILVAVTALTVGFYFLMNQGGEEAPRIETVKVLVATDHIPYGQALVLPHKNEEGEQVAGNVNWKNWPKGLLPEGAVKDAAKVQENTVVSQVMLTKGMPVLEAQLLPKDELKPEDMVLIEMPADRALIRLRDLRPGVIVNITYLSATEQFDVMRCVQVYAIGGVSDLTEDGLPPTKSPENANSVLVLIPNEYYENMRQYKLRYGGKLEAVISQSECGDGPVMVLKEEEGPDVAAAMRALRAEQEREEKINEAVGMADEGRFMAAVEALTGDDPVRAAQLVWQWEEQAAQAIYEEARQAYEDGRLDEAEEALARLEEMRKPFEQARDLRRSIAAQRSGADRRDDYGELINTLEAAIKAGNFPVAQQALTQLQEYTAGNYEPAGDQPLPDEAVQEGNRNLDEARSEFDLEVRILRAHLERNRCDRAREKLNEIKKQFPEHPDIETLEEAVVECEEGAE